MWPLAEAQCFWMLRFMDRRKRSLPDLIPPGKNMIDYARALNSAQYAAVTSEAQAALVIAGAGSGKTRVIVYRLAWLVEHGMAPESILLLTFTRKAAQEMLERASSLAGTGLSGIAGGTFHSHAYSFLRAHPPAWLKRRPFTLLDASDVAGAIRQCREALKIGKKDSSFPKTQTIASLLSKARNKELSIEELLRRDSFHLLPHAEAIVEIGNAYDAFRKANGLLDYDDLLFEMQTLLLENGQPAQAARQKFRQILVDEYQDTNLVQARITRLLAGDPDSAELSAKVMAVGDDAQSIYAFRGANVRNILDFPKLFPNSSLLRLEENYRSTQPILDVANDILGEAREAISKRLFTSKKGGAPVRVIRPLSEASQATLVVQRIQELLQTCLPHEIAVLFRAGFHSYLLENELRQAGIKFIKYGGLRFVEAAHIKDFLSVARLVLNPLDLPAFSRIAAMHKGVGPKTIAKVHDQLSRNDVAALKKSLSRHAGLLEDLIFVDELRSAQPSPADFFEKTLAWYRPRLEVLYPDDWPGRLQGLEEIGQIASAYKDLDLLVADLALEAPDENADADSEQYVTLSTVHSAKGLEWSSVLVIDLAEDRFPSRHAMTREEDYEEERRLFYVACTRARNTLDLYSPQTVYSRQDGASVPVKSSPFIAGLKSAEAWRENYVGGLRKETPAVSRGAAGEGMLKNAGEAACVIGKGKTGYCRHKIFGRGKIIKFLDDEKAQVNFPGFGLKVILANYLQLEE